MKKRKKLLNLKKSSIAKLSFLAYGGGNHDTVFIPNLSVRYCKESYNAQECTFASYPDIVCTTRGVVNSVDNACDTDVGCADGIKTD